MTNAEKAILRLKEGNERFLSGTDHPAPYSRAQLEHLAASAHTPYAVVVTCADSRVPPELIFSARLGELFVIRTAGSVINEFVSGSIEYGVKVLGAAAIIVMGHTQCGAVSAALTGGADGCIRFVADEISSGIGGETDWTRAVTKNAAHSASKILQNPAIRNLAEAGTIQIVTALYHMNSGHVHFDPPISPK